MDDKMIRIDKQTHKKLMRLKLQKEIPIKQIIRLLVANKSLTKA